MPCATSCSGFLIPASGVVIALFEVADDLFSIKPYLGSFNVHIQCRIPKKFLALFYSCNIFPGNENGRVKDFEEEKRLYPYSVFKKRNVYAVTVRADSVKLEAFVGVRLIGLVVGGIRMS